MSESRILTSLRSARASENLRQSSPPLLASEDEPVPLLLDLLLLLQRDPALDLPRVKRRTPLAQVTVILK